MSSRTKPSTAQLAELAQVHIYYEVAMLRTGAAENRRRPNQQPDLMKLDRADSARASCMVFFEATLLHARVLNDFLTVSPNRYPDDVWAGDYIKNWTPPAPGPLKRTISVAKGRGIKETINTQLAHLSLKRLNQTQFYTERIAEAVLYDMSAFANDLTNVCHAEFQGVRDLIARNPWPTG